MKTLLLAFIILIFSCVISRLYLPKTMQNAAIMSVTGLSIMIFRFLLGRKNDGTQTIAELKSALGTTTACLLIFVFGRFYRNWWLYIVVAVSYYAVLTLPYLLGRFVTRRRS